MPDDARPATEPGFPVGRGYATAVAALLGVALLFLSFGLPLLVLDRMPPSWERAGSVVLIAEGLIAGLLLVRRRGWTRAAVAFGLALGLSFAAEWIGVATGWPYGAYVYTDRLGPRLFGAVPLAIPFAWTTLVLGGYLTAESIVLRLTGRTRPILTALVGAALATGIDLGLEPAAALARGYWTWLEPGPYYGVPTMNFVGWFATALVLYAVCLPWVRVAARPAGAAIDCLPVVLLGLNAVWSLAIQLGRGYWAAAAITVAISVLTVALTAPPAGWARFLRQLGRVARQRRPLGLLHRF